MTTEQRSEVRAHILRGVSEADYHNDDVGQSTPTLSASIAATLVLESPKHAWLAHPKLGGHRWEPTTASDMGSAIHNILLEGGNRISVIYADDYRKSQAQELRDSARAAGSIPILKAKHEQAKEVCLAISKQMLSLGVPLDGDSELAVTWTEQTPLGPIWCRGKLDHLRLSGHPRIIDLKTTAAGVRPRQCASRIVDAGYDIQAAAYTSAVEKLMPHMAGRVEFIFVFAEVDPPYAVTAVRPDGSLRELGRRRWDRACREWAQALQSNVWRMYADRVVDVGAPVWSLAQEMEEN